MPSRPKINYIQKRDDSLMKSKRISLIIIQYGSANLLMRLLISLKHHPDNALISEAIIVNNGLGLEKSVYEQLISNILPFSLRIVDNFETSYASGLNRGVNIAKEKTLLLVNNDIEWLPEFSIQPLLECIQNPGVGMVGPQLVYPDGKWQRSYGSFPSVYSALASVMMLDSFIHFIRARQFRLDNKKSSKHVDYIDGAFMCIRRDCFQEIGGFDENFQFYSEDADFCWRMKQANYKVVFIPSVHIMHVRGASSIAKSLAKYTGKLLTSKREFVAKHHNIIRAKWYERIMKYAYFERAVLFNALAKLTNLSIWKKRASEAKERYKGVI